MSRSQGQCIVIVGHQLPHAPLQNVWRWLVTRGGSFIGLRLSRLSSVLGSSSRKVVLTRTTQGLVTRMVMTPAREFTLHHWTLG